MKYAFELLESEQRRLTKMLEIYKQFISEGYKYFIDMAKYQKQLEEVNKALEKLNS